jgi:hypothetical protein
MESIGMVLHIQRSRVVREVLIFSASPRALPPSLPISLSTEIHQNGINWNGAAHPRSRVVREVLIFSASPRALPPSPPIPLPTEIHQNGINWNGAAHLEVKSSEGGVDLQCTGKGSSSFFSYSIIHRDTSEWNQLEWCCTSRG